MTANVKAGDRWIIVVFSSLLLGIIALIVAGWFYLHTLPREAEVIAGLARADKLEIVRMRDDNRYRVAILTDQNHWRDLAGKLRFHQLYWRLSERPREEIVVLRIMEGERCFLALDLRGTGSLHLHKGSQWYQMPMDEGFEEAVLALLAEHGEVLIPDVPTTVK